MIFLLPINSFTQTYPLHLIVVNDIQGTSLTTDALTAISKSELNLECQFVNVYVYKRLSLSLVNVCGYTYECMYGKFNYNKE